MRVNRTLAGTLLSAWAIAACGGDGGNGNNSNLVLDKTSTASGDGQTAVVATAPPQELRVVLTEDGSPKADATIARTAIHGSVNSLTSTTDGSGIATTDWTLAQSWARKTPERRSWA